MPPRLLCFGYSYTAKALTPGLIDEGWQVSATYRSGDAAAEIEADGCKPVPFEKATVDDYDHLLSSVPPGENGDPVLGHYRDDIASAGIRWIGYLSTTGVYGNTNGALVDETADLNPTAERSVRRVTAEQSWMGVSNMPVHIFRLAGIYGPGRSSLEALRGGTARRVEREGYAFSRIHVDDIAAILRASMAAPNAGAVYNVCDDEAAPQSDVVAYAAKLLDMEPPPVVAYEQVAPEMSPMARSFWQDNRRVSNVRIKSELGVELAYPTYREGLRAIHMAGGGLTY